MTIPEWHGANVTYKRLIEINARLSSEAYEAGKMINGVFCWTMPKTVMENFRAMNDGDEKACKAGVSKNFHLIKNYVDTYYERWNI